MSHEPQGVIRNSRHTCFTCLYLLIDATHHTPKPPVSSTCQTAKLFTPLMLLAQIESFSFEAGIAVLFIRLSPASQK